MAGMVIVFDGPDGVGKSTQLKLTEAWLKELGHDVHTGRASGGTPIGEALRSVSLADIPRPAETDVYISLAMGIALGQDLRGRVARGQICLVDRSPAAIIAYNAYGSELSNKQLAVTAFEDMLKLWNINQMIIIDADQAVINQRRAKRIDKPQDYFEKQDHAYHQRVREGYSKAIQLIESHPEWGIELVRIDGAPSEAQVQERVRQAIKNILA